MTAQVDYPLLGKILKKKSDPNVFFRCEELNILGRCHGPVLLNIRNMSKEYIIDATLDLMIKYGQHSALTELLDDLNAPPQKKGCCT